MYLVSLLLLVLFWLSLVHGDPDVSFFKDEKHFVLSNGFSRFEFALDYFSLTQIFQSNDGSLPAASLPYTCPSSSSVVCNLLSSPGVVFESEYVDAVSGVRVQVSSGDAQESYDQSKYIDVQITHQSPDRVDVNFRNISAYNTGSTVSVLHSLSVSLSSSSSTASLFLSSAFSPLSFSSSSVSGSLSRASLVFYFSPLSITSFFSRGIVQMMNMPSLSYFASDEAIDATTHQGVYAMAVQRGSVFLKQTANSNKNNSVTYTLLSSTTLSGVRVNLLGQLQTLDTWTNDATTATPDLVIDREIVTDYAANVAVNQYDFPTTDQRDGIWPHDQDDNQTAAKLFSDFRAFQTSLYGGCAGSLVTYLVPHVGSPTIAAPSHAYSPLYSFYDPDNWLTVVALSYSGVPYLANQARLMLESHLSAVLSTGQLPHHFEGDITHPTYVAISGATQTGPNIFWTLAALSYSKTTGDTAWLLAHLDQIHLVVSFLTNMVHSAPAPTLLYAQGPLYIDTFIRNQYTLDSNAMMILLLNELIEVETYFNNTEQASAYTLLRDNISDALLSKLWSTDGDHFVTQLNEDGSTRDFVDYDSNYIAVNALLSGTRDEDAQQRQRVLTRLDQGKCTHAGRATYVSELYYDAANTYNGNTGDSDITMGRIAYFDAHAHTIDAKNGLPNGDVGLSFVEDVILNPLIKDVEQNAFLPERYTCDGQPTHNANMHEYSELVVMLIRELSYGIRLSFSSFTIRPLLRSSFIYRIGSVFVDYLALDAVTFCVPGDAGLKQVEIYGMLASSSYQVRENGVVVTTSDTDEKGTLVFQAKISNDYTYQITKSASSSS